MEFGKKEKVLNYANQTYQLSRPNKVGAVMAPDKGMPAENNSGMGTMVF